MKIYTLGTSNRDIEEFIEILKSYEVKTVIDVRRFPNSKFSHFKKENFERILKDHDFNYVYLGRELGGYRKEGYEKYTETEEFEKGINRIIKLSESENVVIVCCERFYWKCHRRFIAEKLKEKSYEVIHIIEKEKAVK